MDSRQHLKALQAQVAAARAAFEAGDREKALEHIDQALSLDPSFLAAQALRERVLAGSLQTAAPVVSSPPPIKTPVKRLASKEAYERIELRARQRRVDHCIAATRAALGRQQPDAAAAALAELIALEPHETNVASLSAELADLRRRFARRPFGVRLAAASAFLAVAGTATWLEHPHRHTTDVVVKTTAVQTAATVEDVPLDSRAITIPILAPPQALLPGPLIPPVVIESTIVQPAVPVGTPVVRPAVTTTAAATAPLSLPVPLSQIPPAPVPTPQPPAAAVVAAAAPVITPTPATARPSGDRELVEEALQRYRRAYGRLNVQSAQAVYPTVNRVALARAFDSLESQSLTFDSCDLDVRETLARAICHGTTHYVPKVGSRYPRSEPLVWSFELRKNDGDWTIAYAKASR